jgi:hypothetical protein
LTRRRGDPARLAATTACLLFLAALLPLPTQADTFTLAHPDVALAPGAVFPLRLTLDNAGSRPAVEVALSFDQSAFELVSIEALGRVMAPLEAHTSLAADGVLYLLFADETAAAQSLPAGTDAIADVTLLVVADSAVAPSPILHAAVAVDSTRAIVDMTASTVIDNNLAVFTEEPKPAAVTEFWLSRNRPNPCRDNTLISFAIPRPEHVTLKVFDVRGRRVRTLVDSRLTPDRYQVTWDGRDHMGRRVASGVYFYRLKSEHFTSTRKLVVLR